MRCSAFLARRPPPGWLWTVGVLLCGAVAACGSTDPATPAPSSHSTGGNPGGAGGARAGDNAGGRSVGASGTGTSAGARAIGSGGATAGTTHGAAGTGLATATAGHAASTPPAPSPDGSSPYERECHGDSLDCEDVPALLCLGIRDDSTIYGYGCSNPCQSDADCTSAPSSAEALAACVDFVTQKHCLLVCLDGTKHSSCPAGMSCYVYPQTTLGYCLWQ